MMTPHFKQHRGNVSRNQLFGLRKTIDYVNTHFLANPFDPRFVRIFPKASVLKRNNHIIFRPNHGLAHTLRSAYLVDKVADLFSEKPMSLREKQKIQAAMLFFVVGRENEANFFDNPDMYQYFREQSAAAFRAYASKNLRDLYENQQEIDKYYQALRNYHDPMSGKIGDIIRTSHCIDLIRCMKAEELGPKIEAYLINDIMKYQGVELTIAQKKARELMDYTAKLIKATGNRIPQGPYHMPCKFSLFERCSKDPEFCLRKLRAT